MPREAHRTGVNNVSNELTGPSRIQRLSSTIDIISIVEESARVEANLTLFGSCTIPSIEAVDELPGDARNRTGSNINRPAREYRSFMPTLTENIIVLKPTIIENERTLFKNSLRTSSTTHVP